MSDNRRVALLIDSENLSPEMAGFIYTTAAGYGDIVVKNIYGGATSLGAWSDAVFRYALHPMLTIRATKGKNTSDLALTIGAMDILHDVDPDVFIIASGDSDFAVLALRLRYVDKTVVGVGGRNVGDMWKVVCTEFATPCEAAPKAAKAETAAKKKPESNGREFLFGIIKGIIADNKGKAPLAAVWQILSSLPSFTADKKVVGAAKPLNYFTKAFGDRLVIKKENNIDVILLKAEETAEEKPAKRTSSRGGRRRRGPGKASAHEEQSAPQESVQTEQAAEEEPAVTVPVVETPAPEVAEADVPETEESSEQIETPEQIETTEEPVYEPEEAAEAPEDGQGGEGPDMVVLLRGIGIEDEDIAGVAGVIEAAPSRFAVYNALRRSFGNAKGRQYYRLICEADRAWENSQAEV